MPKLTPEYVLNRIFGSKNILLDGSDNNTIHVGDQNIFYDLGSESLKTACPVCHEPAEESEAEESQTYKSFECSSCGEIYYEHDIIASNVSSYIDLDYAKGKEFERLISAVNHDIKVGHYQVAYNRCDNHKETYGNTPQIYEWGALTLFYNTPIDELIKSSCSKIILYLNRSIELSGGKKTKSYEEISSSIATRYFRAVYDKIFFTKVEQSLVGDLDKDELKSTTIEYRRKIYKLLLELKTCYRISNDTDFAIKGLEELYGYHGISWFERKFSSIFQKIKYIPDGFRRGLKGYAWDYHRVVPNGNRYFENFRTKPDQLAIYFENILIKKNMEDNLSEIRVGSFFDKPISARANLTLISICVHGAVVVLIIVLWLYVSIFLSVLIGICYLGVVYLNKKANQTNLDAFRRVISIEKEGDILKTLGEVTEELDLDEIQQKVKETLKINRK